MSDSQTIGVFGAGWVGLVTGGCFADLGHEVIVRDVVPDRIAALNAGRVPFHEQDLPEMLSRNRERMHYTLDAADVLWRRGSLIRVVGTRRPAAERAAPDPRDEVDRPGRHR